MKIILERKIGQQTTNVEGAENATNDEILNIMIQGLNDYIDKLVDGDKDVKKKLLSDILGKMIEM